MRENAVFEKAMTLLVHPISIFAIGLYTLNTFVFQKLAPNWWTGKLGDLTWLFFMPFALTALSAWLLPAHYRRHAFLFSMISIAFMFTLVKATSFNGWMVSNLEELTGMPISVVQDPSDLLALAGLSATIFLWSQPQTTFRTKRRLGLLLMPLLALLTLADSAAPNLGITTVEFIDNRILACNGYYGALQSDDGGVTWQDAQQGCKEMVFSPEYGEIQTDPNNEQIEYKFKPGLIERSEDGGDAWKTDYQWMLPTEAEQLYYIVSNKAYMADDLPPFSCNFEPHNGDVFFAMGHEGILKRSAGAEPHYTWITVGDYKKIEYSKSTLVFNLLFGELMLALAMGGVGIIWIDIAIQPNKFKRFLLILSVIGITAFVFIFPPAPTSAEPYLGQLVPMGLALLVLIIFIPTAIAFYNIGTKTKRLLPPSVIGFLLVAAISFTPYVLWVFDIIPQYRNVSNIAATLAVLGVIGLQVFAKKGISHAKDQE